MFDKDLRMVFAFNERFAEFDFVNGDVVYRSCEDVLCEIVGSNDLGTVGEGQRQEKDDGSTQTDPEDSTIPSSPVRPIAPRSRGRRSVRDMKFRYALQGKK